MNQFFLVIGTMLLLTVIIFLIHFILMVLFFYILKYMGIIKKYTILQVFLFTIAFYLFKNKMRTNNFKR
jgi:hypothetical protein